MAAATARLGFVVTVSCTYEQPYALARKLTTLDHLTDGRIGWNVVTSALDSAARRRNRPAPFFVHAFETTPDAAVIRCPPASSRTAETQHYGWGGASGNRGQAGENPNNSDEM